MDDPSSERVRVLYVGADSSASDPTETALESEPDFSLQRAATARAGLDHFERSTVDCVVTNYHLSEGNGLDLLRWIRERDAHLPVLLCVADGDERLASEAVSAGVTAYLPVDAGAAPPADLVGRIKEGVDQRWGRRDPREHLGAFVDEAFLFSGLLAPDGTILTTNDRSLSFGGMDRAETVGERLWETDWFESNREARTAVREAVIRSGAGDPFRGEIRVRGANGEAVIDCSIRPVTDDRGAVTVLVLDGRDVTDRKARRRELRRSERRLEAVFQDPKMLVGVLSPDGRLRKANRTAMGFVDADHDDLIGTPFWETPWWTDDIRSDVRDWIERAAEGEYVEYEADHVRSDTGQRSVSGTVRPVTDETGETVSLIVSARDITERRERERELRTRNARLHEFASVVSHDLRSPLNVADGHLAMARDERDSDHLDETAHALDRMGDLIEDLLTLAHEGERVSDVGRVDLEGTVRDCWRNVAGTADTLRVETERVIRADRSQLQHLLENLLTNACEHGGEKVTVTVADFAGGFYVADDGTGIPRADREAVFETGYSTSEDGTGFGLSIVERIVAAHAWSIDVTESEAGGTRFEITGVECVDTSPAPN